MITENDITSVTREKLFNHLNVKKIGNGIYSIIEYHYGDEESKFKGEAKEAAKFLNQYFGYSNKTV